MWRFRKLSGPTVAARNSFRKRRLPTGTATSATRTGRCVFRLGKTANNCVTEAISIHRKIDSDTVSFHFGVQFAVR
jgi:hypothetical protein